MPGNASAALVGSSLLIRHPLLLDSDDQSEANGQQKASSGLVRLVGSAQDPAGKGVILGAMWRLARSTKADLVKLRLDQPDSKYKHQRSLGLT